MLVPESREKERPIKAIKLLGRDVIAGVLLYLVPHVVRDAERLLSSVVAEEDHLVIVVVHGIEVVHTLDTADLDVMGELLRVPHPFNRTERLLFVGFGEFCKLAEAEEVSRWLVGMGLVDDLVDGEAGRALLLVVLLFTDDLHDELEGELLRVRLLEPSRVWICFQVLLQFLGPLIDDGVEEVEPVVMLTKPRGELEEILIIPELGISWIVERI